MNNYVFSLLKYTKASFFSQNLLHRSQDRTHTLLFSTTMWSSGRTVSPLSPQEASLSLIPWKTKACQWGKTGMEERESPAGYTANTLLHGAMPPSLSLHHSVLTARGFAPGCKIPPCISDPQYGEIRKYLPTFSPHVGPWPLKPRDMSTIITMSTIIITTITTTLRKSILNSYETGEKSWSTPLICG